jgi:predicted HTH transcriptional regulator
VSDPYVPARLVPLLGEDLDSIDEQGLARLIGVPEDDDIDYKSDVYSGSERKRYDLPTDVAAFANWRGGLIVIGIEAEPE